MRTRSTLICSFSALFCASSSSTSSFRLSLSSESSVSGGIPDLNQPRVMRSMPKARVKPTQRGEQLPKEAQERGAKENWRIPATDWAPAPNYRGKGLQLQFIVEDEGVFTMPWSATITYRRPLATEMPETVCAENRHEYYAGRDT